jgi:hypothetical protein
MVIAERVKYRLYVHTSLFKLIFMYNITSSYAYGNYFVVQSSGSRAENITYLIDLYSLFFVTRDLHKLFSQGFAKLALISQYSHRTFEFNSKVFLLFLYKAC